MARDTARGERPLELVAEPIFADESEYSHAARAEGCQVVGDGPGRTGCDFCGNHCSARDACLARGFRERRIVAAPSVETHIAYDQRAQLRKSSNNFGRGHAFFNSLHNAGNVARTKRMVLRAFETQFAGTGFSFVEILTMCPTGWFIETEEAPDYIDDRLSPVHPLGILKDELRDDQTGRRGPHA